MVGGDITGMALVDFTWRVAEGIPDRLTAPVLVVSAFDLVSGGGGTPDEARRKGEERCLSHRFLSVDFERG